MTLIPDSHKDLFTEPVVVTFVTIMPDGQPQATPVWCDYDGDHILVNTAAGRQKDKNVRARPKVTVLAIDPQNPYRWIEVRGEVEHITEEGALDSINKLAKLYVGADRYYGGVAPADMAGKETRVLLRITPKRVLTSG